MIWNIIAASGAVVLSLLILGSAATALFVYLRRVLAVEKPHGNDLESLSARVADIEIQVKGLPSLWEDERKRAKRDADAARKARSVAEEKLAEVEELLETHGEIPGGHEEVLDRQGVLPLSARLGDPPASDKQERIAAIAHLLR